MPELPEVETVRRGLHELIIGKVITTETHDTAKGFPNAPADVAQFLLGARVTDVRRRAKVLLIDLSTSYSLVIHLKMTGQLVFVGLSRDASFLEATRSRQENSAPTSLRSAELASLKQSSIGQEAVADSSGLTRASIQEASRDEVRFGAGHPNDSLVGALPDKSTRVTLAFTDGSHLFFNDQRKFGWMKLYPTIEVPNIDFMQKVGPEPLEDDFTADILYERLQRRKNTTIKAAILDQTVLAGVGNIYADEGLWGAKIHPATRVKDVPRSKITDLWREIREVMTLAIEKGGSSNHTYINAEGKKGSYMDFARAFRREGQPCPRHPDVLIEKIKVAGRGTHICPVCQPTPGGS